MRIRWGILALLCVSVATLRSQDGPPPQDGQPPTFVTGVHYVRVDLYATQGGRLIDDLWLDEIELYEDGVRQTIEALERIEFRRADAAGPLLDPRTLEASRQAARDPRARVFVVFLDRWHTEYFGQDAAAGDHAPMVQARFPLVREFEARLGPDDLVGVMTPDMRAEDVTFIRGLGGLAQVEATWDRYSPLRPDPGRDLDAQEELYLACYPPEPGGWRSRTALAYRMIDRRRERMALDALEDLAGYLGELREERKAVLVVTDGWSLYLPDERMLQRRGDDGPPPLPFGPPDTDRTIVISSETGTRQLSAAARQQCEGDRATLATLDHSRRLQEIAARANRANVSFYPISPAGLIADRRDQGLTPAGQVTREAEQRARGTLPVRENTTLFALQTSLRGLAEDTDGLAVVNTNNVAGGVERIIADTSAYYLLGYTSTNTTLDGRFRRITVRVNRPDVDVRARPGYVASPLREGGRAPTARNDVSTTDPVSTAFAAIAAVETRTAVRLRAASWARDGGEGGLLWITGELDAQTRREPAWRNGGTADIAVVAEDGRTVGSHVVEFTAVASGFVVRAPEGQALPPGDYEAGASGAQSSDPGLCSKRLGRSRAPCSNRWTINSDAVLR